MPGGISEGISVARIRELFSGHSKFLPHTNGYEQQKIRSDFLLYGCPFTLEMVSAGIAAKLDGIAGAQTELCPRHGVGHELSTHLPLIEVRGIQSPGTILDHPPGACSY
jgi:hypothetical protein